MGSTENQVTTKLNEELEKITNTPGIRVSYQNVYHREATATLWKEAKEKATDKTGHTNNNLKHQWAPAALTIFIPDYKHAKSVRKTLYTNFGQNVEDDHGNKDAYPTWPGGAQMKFVPLADRKMSAANKEKISTRLRMHTSMKGNQVTLPNLIKDPDMTMDCLEGKMVGEAILQIMTKDKKNPLFRHFKKDWHRDIDEKSFSLVAHSVFEKEARQCAYTLKNYMIDKYGESMLDAFTNGTAGLNNPHDTYDNDSSDFGFDMEDDNEDKLFTTQYKSRI